MTNNQKTNKSTTKEPNKTSQPAPKGTDRGQGARHDEDEEEAMKTRTKDADASGDNARQAPGANSDRQSTRGSDVNSSRRDRE